MFKLLFLVALSIPSLIISVCVFTNMGITYYLVLINLLQMISMRNMRPGEVPEENIEVFV